LLAIRGAWLANSMDSDEAAIVLVSPIAHLKFRRGERLLDCPFSP